MLFTIKLYLHLNCVLIRNWSVFIKMDLALNNLQRLICHKTQTTNQLFSFVLLILVLHGFDCSSLLQVICKKAKREREREGGRERGRERLSFLNRTPDEGCRIDQPKCDLEYDQCRSSVAQRVLRDKCTENQPINQTIWEIQTDHFLQSTRKERSHSDIDV